MCIQQLWVRKSVPVDQNHIVWIVRRTLEHFFSRCRTVPNSLPKLHWNWHLLAVTLVASAILDVLQDYDNQNKSKNYVFLSWYDSIISRSQWMKLKSVYLRLKSFKNHFKWNQTRSNYVGSQHWKSIFWFCVGVCVEWTCWKDFTIWILLISRNST